MPPERHEYPRAVAATDVNAYIAAREAPIAAILEAARRAIHEELPGAVEWVNGWKMLAFGPQAKMNAMVFVLDPRTDRVNLEIAGGAELDDPTHLLEGTGKSARHIKLRDPADLERPEVRLLIRAGATARPSWGR